MKKVCIIPAWNEEKTIGKVVREARKYVDEVIVVDDGSSDRTKEIAEKEQAIVLSHIINRGQGAALETGNQLALKRQADIVVHFDADGQFLPEEIPEVIRPLVDNISDIVFGSRFISKKSNIPWFKKNVIIPLAHIVNYIFIGASLTDPQSGFRAMNKEAIGMISIDQDNMAHCTEIIFKAHKNKLRISEVPIKVIYRNFGQRFSGGVDIIKDLIIARLIN